MTFELSGGVTKRSGNQAIISELWIVVSIIISQRDVFSILFEFLRILRQT